MMKIVCENSYNLRAYSGSVCVFNSQIKKCYVVSMKPSPLNLLSNFPVILFSRRMFQIWAHSSHHLLARNVSEYAKKSNYSNALLAAEKSWPCISSTALYKTIQIRDADFLKLCDRVPKLVTCNHIYLSAKIYPLKFTSSKSTALTDIRVIGINPNEQNPKC